MMQEPENSAVCDRIAKVRLEVAGPRGKSSFAKKLGISPSTYAYYESSRVPPADVLVRIADVAGVDLRWLLTGETGGGSVPADHPVVRRISQLLGERPNAAAPLAAFLDVLAESFHFPAKPAATEAPADATPASLPAATADPEATWIPVLGRSAAGVPHFWSSAAEAAGVTLLDELVTRHAQCAADRVSPASAAAEEDDASEVVQVLTLRTPNEDGVVEFLAAETVKRRYPDAFALRVDGDSMAPDICHGDLVILSPSVPADDGRLAVVQLDHQIGVTCKLYRLAGNLVHLIPLNEQFGPLALAANHVVWALRVLARVRVQPGSAE
jgi:SOS-response transcriptional repressor LexA